MALQIPAAKARASRQDRAKGLSFRLFVSLFLSSFFLSQSLFAQTPQAANLQVGHDSWGFKEGAPADIMSIAQTSDGFLWLAAPTGLFRFDGTRFERFRSPFGDQLLSNNLRTVFAPPSGGVWIGYMFGGFSFLHSNGRLANYGGEAASSGSVNRFAQDHNGNLWAGTTSGLWRFDGSLWQHIGAEWNVPAGQMYDLAFDSQGVLWALAGGSPPAGDLLYLRPNSGHFQTAERNPRIYALTLDANGSVVTDPRGKPPVPNSSSSEPSGYPITAKESAAIIDRTGSIWVISAHEPSIRRLPPSDQIYQALNQSAASNSEVYPVNPLYGSRLVDREGNVWFGEAKGLHRFFYTPFVRLEEVRKDVAWYAVAADDNGAVWIATNKQLQHFSHGKIDAIKKLERSTSFPNFAFRAPDRTFWFATDHELWHLAGRTWTRVALPPDMADQVSFLQTITQDSQGGMWISFGRHGLFRLANGVWTPYGGHEDLPKTGVVIEFTDQQGRVWFGYTKNTLAVLDGDRVQVFGPNDGLRVGNVTAIQGRGPAIWIGGEFGLQQYDQGRFHDIHAVDDELLRGISGIVETGSGDLWLNGLSGIFHIPHTEISEARKDPNYLVKGEHFGRREGLLGLAFQLRPLNTAIEGTDGRRWFTGSGGVVSVDPAQSEKKVPAPPATILSVSADDKFYPPGGPLQLPAHTSNVQISYAAVSLSDPEAISYRYKLQETDKDWHVVATASPVSYRNLAPGPYHFSVNATDTNGVWSDKVATAEFTILPAFYQTAWFRVLCLAAFCALLWTLYQLRLQQLDKQFHMRLEERVSERTRIARELHDSMLQGFQGLMFRLQAVRDMLPGRAPVEAIEALDVALERGDKAIAEGRDTVADLRQSVMEDSDIAQALTALGEELAAQSDNGAAPCVRVLVEGEQRELNPMLRDEVYRIAREALRNAFRHAKAQKIEAEITYGDSEFLLHVRDDGSGIDPAVGNQGARAGHWGLPGMRERAKRFGGKLEVWSEHGVGTEVKLSVPATIAYGKSDARVRGFWFWRKKTEETNGQQS